MQISNEHIDDLSILVNVVIEPEDYQPLVNKELKKLKKDAVVKGFRKGMVPMGMIKKMFGVKVLAEQIDKLLNETLSKHMKDNKWTLVGQALPRTDTQTALNINKAQNYEFAFDVGTTIDFDVPVLTDDSYSFEKYDITISEEKVEEHINTIRERNAKPKNVESDVQENDVLKVKFDSLNEAGEVVTEADGGISVENYINLELVNEDKRAEVLGLDVNGTIDIAIFDFFNKTAEDIAKHLLYKGDTPTTELPTQFKMTILEIKRSEKADLGEELYAAVFPNKQLKDFESFKQALIGDMQISLGKNAESKLATEIIEKIIETTEVPLPKSFLRKYLLAQSSNQKEGTPEFDKIYETNVKDLSRHLIMQKIATEHNLSVSEKEVTGVVEQDLIRGIYQQTGGFNISQEQYQKLRQQALGNKNYLIRIREMLLEQKVGHKLIDIVNVGAKSVTIDEWQELNKPKEIPAETATNEENVTEEVEQLAD